MIDTFWHDFLLWHIRTEHPWDVALHKEAISLRLISIEIEVIDRISPVLTKLIADLDRILSR